MCFLSWLQKCLGERDEASLTNIILESLIPFPTSASLLCSSKGMFSDKYGCVGLKPPGQSQIHMSMSVGIVHFWSIIRQSCWWDFVSLVSHIPIRHNITKTSLILWILQYFCLFFFVPWGLVMRIVLWMHPWVWHSQHCILIGCGLFCYFFLCVEKRCFLDVEWEPQVTEESSDRKQYINWLFNHH